MKNQDHKSLTRGQIEATGYTDNYTEDAKETQAKDSRSSAELKHTSMTI